ncbi:MAG TPA: protein kinase [Polyangia bacterium]|nr:protein kinase [Polyangia bacterium]
MTEPRATTELGPYLVVPAGGGAGLGRAELALRSDGKDPELCVLKRLPAPAGEADRERQLLHGSLLARLEHENIARTLRVEQIDGQLCVAQEFVEGVNLAKVMRQLGARPLPRSIAVHIVREVARGLGYAHGFGRLGIVHRDVTPENIRLSFDGDVKLVDFGIAHSAVDEEVTNLGVVVGRRSYVPPEASAGGQVDARADVFALGVVLWEVLTGHRAEETPEPALPDVRELNPDVGPLLAQIGERAMAPAPEDRFQSADELGAALAAFASEAGDARRELAHLLASCFDVPGLRQAVADETAEAKRVLDERAAEAAETASLQELAERWPAPPTVAMVAPAPTGKRRQNPGPWIAATLAALVATSGIGLLRTHGRSARSRASAEPLAAVPAPRPSSLEAATERGPAQRAPGPPAVEPAPVAPELPEPAASEPALPEPAPGATERLETAGAEAPHLEPPRRVEGRTPDGIDRPAHDTAADELLRKADDLWERGNTVAAFALARQAAAAGAGAPAHLLLGTLLINQRNFVAAQTELETAARLDPRNGEARRLLALLRKTAAERR